MKNIFGKFSAILGYLLYGGVVLILLLWLLFPTDALKSYIEARGSRLAPAWQLRIGEFHLVHPLFLRVRNCDISRSKNKDKSLFHIDTIRLKPDIMLSLRELRPRFLYEIHMLDGVVTGKMQIEPRGKEIDLSADFKNIHPDMAEALNILLGRQIHGTITGTLHYKGDLHTPLQGELQAGLRATEGDISLLQPILGMEQLAFKSVSANFSGLVNELEVSSGKIDTPLFKGSFEGTINGALKVSNSNLAISGELTPLEELFRKGEDDPTVMLVRSYITDGVLPFSLSGTLHNPGILFQRELSEENMAEQDNGDQGGAEQQ